MARKSRSNGKSRAKEAPKLNPRAKKELSAITLLIIAAVSFLAFFDLAGPAGTMLDAGISAIFGFNKYIFPFFLIILAGRIAWPEKFLIKSTVTLGLFLFLVSWGGLLNTVRFPSRDALLFIDNISRGGGYIGLLLAYPLLSLVDVWAAAIILAGLIFVSLVIVFNVSIHEISSKFLGLRHRAWPWPFGHRGLAAKSLPQSTETEPPSEFSKRPIGDQSATVEGTVKTATRLDPLTAAIQKKRSKPISIPLEMLENKIGKPTAGDIHGRMLVIKKTLDNFGIPVEMGEISVGPTVTQFTLKPAEGIKLSRLTGLSNDLALALAAHPIRIEAPIPGKSLVGIEVPNQAVAVVNLREVLESKQFQSRPSNLAFCLGKDVAGMPWVADLGKMPHLLVAGATGSGKTVCLNSIIVSLLYQNNPDDLKLILIDPKRVELPTYNGIPHLLTPAITEVPKIINALKWAIGEMDRRFDLLSKSGKRDIASYNQSAQDRLPYLVIIIDELADLMAASASEVEASIIRLAQMARAVGIHLIVATQRPSVDVITGLIKANITSRIAFSVASATDSRTILDTTGAEKLVGRGDMLFVSSDLSKPKRIQCCYVGDGDIRRVVDHLMSQLDEPVNYAEGVTERRNAAGRDFGYKDGGDELFEEARETVVRAGKASASYLQRRLKVGYARAARLLDLLEERGIIGPGDGAKPRQILAAPVQDADGFHFNDDAGKEEDAPI